ncbi:hypothetical protein K2Y11_21825 [bacterium]|nr:hypothetical protein [bacterium]
MAWSYLLPRIVANRQSMISLTDLNYPYPVFRVIESGGTTASVALDRLGTV